MAKMSNRGPTKRFLISEMDRSVKRMLKLIEEEGDSFAKKAEIYIQKRPELVHQVEDFYRMFRSLAERYDDATCELRRTLPSDLRSQNCGMSEICSEPPSAITSPEHRFSRRLSGTHAAYFEIAAASKGFENSAYDSGSDPDDSVFNNYSASSNYGNYRRLRRKITELENELRKLQIEQEVNRSNSEIAEYEEELRIAKEKIRSSEEEICNLKTKLEKYESLQYDDDNDDDDDDDDNDDDDTCSDDAESDGNNLRRDLDPDCENVDDYMDETEPETEDEIEQLKSEREEFVMKVRELEEELSLKDDQIDELNNRLQKLHLECEKSSESIQELEKVVEKQRVMIEEGAEEKRQTERELCNSLEHYRNAYQMLRKGLLDQKKPVMAS
ncbi:hypothetical protein SSX86_015393 [Deinandra increscens subsp. villosa]|uniref:NAB domain-containing protein n=1 Tax=Deinandra increscens subsp. villosa TaxID=3103831 RepID=A0AAP0D1D0_9ASTR